MFKKILILWVCFFSFNLVGQSKANIRKNKVRSMNSEASKIEDGKTIVKKEIEVFDDYGNIVEKTVFINNKLEERASFKYNKNNYKIEHVFYNGDGTIKKKEVYKYNSSGEKVEELTYDAKGTLIKKEVIVFNAYGEKTSESVYDGNGILVEKSVYKYDNKGLKTERLTYDSENRLIGKKVYSYTFK